MVVPKIIRPAFVYTLQVAFYLLAVLPIQLAALSEAQRWIVAVLFALMPRWMAPKEATLASRAALTAATAFASLLVIAGLLALRFPTIYAVAPLYGLTIGIAYGLTAPVARRSFITSVLVMPVKGAVREHRGALIGWGLLIGLVLLDAVGSSVTGRLPYHSILGESVAYDLLILCWLCGFWILLLAGYHVSRRVFAPIFHAFTEALPYLRVMAPSVLGFGAIYLLIVGWFATLYYAIDRVAQSAAFGGVSGTGLHWQFLTYSLMTVTALGHSTIRPTSLWTADLAAAEWLIALGWTVVVFAAVMARVTALFSARLGTEPPVDAPVAHSERLCGEIVELREELRRVRAERDDLARRRVTLTIPLPFRRWGRRP